MAFFQVLQKDFENVFLSAKLDKGKSKISFYTKLEVTFSWEIQLAFTMKAIRIILVFLVSLLGTSQGILKCQRGYSLVQNSICLQIVAHPDPQKNPRFMVPWKDAKKRCETDGGRLYEPQNERVQRIVIRGLQRQLAKFRGKISFWIGVDDIKKENQ